MHNINFSFFFFFFFFCSTHCDLSTRKEKRKNLVFSVFLLVHNCYWLLYFSFLLSFLSRYTLFFFNFCSLLFIIFCPSISTCHIESVNSTTMLTPLATKEEDEAKISSEYYSTHYTTPYHHYYYHPVPFNNEPNNIHHTQTPNRYDPTQYYTLSPSYSHPQATIRIDEEDSNNRASSSFSSSICMPIYHHYHHHRCSPEEMLFTQKTLDPPENPIYDYNVSPIATVQSNQMFHQHTNYVQTLMEQKVCSTSNNGDYSSPYVREYSIFVIFSSAKSFDKIISVYKILVHVFRLTNLQIFSMFLHSIANTSSTILHFS